MIRNQSLRYWRIIARISNHAGQSRDCGSLRADQINLGRGGDDAAVKLFKWEDAEGKPLTPLLQSILDERQKELYIEGDRWFELKRNGCPEWWVIQQSGSTLPVKYVVRRYLYTMPVSVRDIRNSQGKIAQNPGYEF